MKAAFFPFFVNGKHAAHRLRTLMIRLNVAAAVALAIGFVSPSQPAIGQQAAAVSTQQEGEWVRDAVALEEHSNRMRESLQKVEPFYDYQVGGIVPPLRDERVVIDRSSGEGIRTEALGPDRRDETAMREMSTGLRPASAETGIRMADMCYGLGLKHQQYNFTSTYLSFLNATVNSL